MRNGDQNFFFRFAICRFENMLSNVSKLCHRSKHKFAEKFLNEMGKCEISRMTDRSKLPNKVFSSSFLY